jgi:NAD(P)-dependent dehydrogenase (short-subunit alcohol dehydrogenase family)
MKSFRGRVAVITGGAAGIGRAMAERLGAAGMKLVLADVEGGVLNRTARELRKAGHKVLAVRTDVSQASSVATGKLRHRHRPAGGRRLHGAVGSARIGGERGRVPPCSTTG